MTANVSVVERFHELALLGMLASGYFALAGSLDLATAVLMLAAMAARVMMVGGVIQLRIPAQVSALLGGACLVFYLLDQRFFSQSFLTATVHLVCFLAVIKILSAVTRRDFAWVRVIALMELLAASLLSVSPAFFLFLALFLMCTIAAFSSGEVLRSMSQGERTISRSGLRLVPRRLTLFSSALFAGVIVMTAGLFFVLPRTARAALQRFVPQRYHLPGFSNEISLGEIGEIKQRSTPVMHVKSYQDEPLPYLRWRGSSLAHFDGTRWFNLPSVDQVLRTEQGVLTLSDGRRSRVGRSLQYEVQLSEIASDLLFFAGTPQTVRINLMSVRRSAGGALRVPRMAVTGLRYGVFATVEDEQMGIVSPPPPLPDSVRREMLQLPALDSRIGILAREMAAGAQTQEQEARAVERHLRTDYSYTLELPSKEVADPLAHFLFERRKGHCEYFASAMAVMLRTLGIPSRVATGFLGGVFNPVSGWQVVRASDAHSWVEAWIDGQGWTTFDPTPPDPNPSGAGLFSGAALLADAMGQFWQDWILSYDLEHQFLLASTVEQSGRRFKLDWFDGLGARLEGTASALDSWWPWLVVAVVGTGLAWKYGAALRLRVGRWLRVERVRRGQAEASDATLLYERMLDLLERRGFRKPPWVTPNEFAGMVPAGPLGGQVARITSAYNAFRFGGQREKASEMLEVLQQIERGT